MTVYISGPITGTNDYMERFKATEILLKGHGCDPVNPAVANSLLPIGTSWERYMGESLRMLCECDAICMMRNWEKSRGAKLEHLVATYLGLKIMDEESIKTNKNR